MDGTPLYEPMTLASVLGIRVVVGFPPPRERVHYGAAGRAIGLEVRTLWIPPEAEPGLAANENPEIDLHEIMHILCQPRGLDIEYVYENYVLLQVERAYAREIFQQQPHAMKRVLAWQANTTIWAEGYEVPLGELDRRCRAWTAGVKVAKDVGLLTRQGRPTYTWPKWNGPESIHRYSTWLRQLDIPQDTR